MPLLPVKEAEVLHIRKAPAVFIHVIYATGITFSAQYTGIWSFLFIQLRKSSIEKNQGLQYKGHPSSKTTMRKKS